MQKEQLLVEATKLLAEYVRLCHDRDMARTVVGIMDLIRKLVIEGKEDYVQKQY